MTTEANEKQEMEADVVIVGYGGAGATAAISAHDSGARVLVLEKMPAGGGSTRVSGGGIFKVLSKEMVRYLEALSLETADKATLEAFVENSIQTEDWIRQIGGDLDSRITLQVTYPPLPSTAHFPKVPGAEHLAYGYHIKGSETEPGGERLWQLLSKNVERRGIRVMTRAPAKELITDEKGEVRGVVAESGGRKVTVKAKRAVILTCGGFEYDEEMKEAFLPCKPFYPLGGTGSTGDGVYMAQKVGAALWHMSAAIGSLGFKAPEYPAGFGVRFYDEGFIFVNKDGKRFFNETGLEYHHWWMVLSQIDVRTDMSRPGYLNIPTYGIFDDVTRRKGPLYRKNSPTGIVRDMYEWSLDNSKEIAKGWIAKANTIRELAARISVDESSLENTVAKYNEYCKAGKDVEFGRSPETSRSIEKPPFYAIELYPCLFGTRGGPRRDKEARVMTRESKPIPRLYAAGELGSIWGRYYSGNSITECLAFGRIAGRNAAAEKPWS